MDSSYDVEEEKWNLTFLVEHPYNFVLLYSWAQECLAIAAVCCVLWT